MTRYIRNFVLACAGAALLAFALAPHAGASSIMMCAPSKPSAALGPGQFTAPSSGNVYSLDNRGCVVARASDQGDFRAAGFSNQYATRQIAVTGITAQDFTSIVLPPSAVILQVVVQNTTANAVTGGVKIGTTAGGTDVVTALTCGASCLTFVADSALSKRVFSATATQALSIDAVTGWNSASLNVTVFYGFF